MGKQESGGSGKLRIMTYNLTPVRVDIRLKMYSVHYHVAGPSTQRQQGQKMPLSADADHPIRRSNLCMSSQTDSDDIMNSVERRVLKLPSTNENALHCNSYASVPEVQAGRERLYATCIGDPIVFVQHRE
jgi:hypothetical protein